MTTRGVKLRATLPHPPSRLLPALTIAIPMTIFGVAALSIPLALAANLGLSAAATASSIAALYGLSALVSAGLALVCRQPLLVAYNVAAMAVVGTLAGHASYAELRGAVLVAGVLVVLFGWLGLSERLSHWLPTPIIMAVVAGAVLPFVTGIFTAWPDAPLAIGGAFAAYILGRRFLPLKATAALPAMIVGVLGAAASGKLHLSALHWAPPVLSFAPPAFSWTATIAVAPVVAILLTVTSNVVSVVYVRGQGYRPSLRLIDAATGAATIAGSWFGLTPMCMAAFLVAPTAGPEAGEREVRHWSVYFTSVGLALTAVLSGAAAVLLGIVPGVLLLALAGLVLAAVLLSTLADALRGPLTWGPLVTFAAAASKMSYLGFGPLFWGLVLGTVTSLILERRELAALRAAS